MTCRNIMMTRWLPSQCLRCLFLQTILSFSSGKYPQSRSFIITCKSIASMQPPRCTILRSVKALEGDLVTLEKRYNLCSEHLAKGETEDFSQEWFGMQLKTSYPGMSQHAPLEIPIEWLTFFVALHPEKVYTLRWLQSLETPSAPCQGGHSDLRRLWRKVLLSAFVCSIYFDRSVSICWAENTHFLTGFAWLSLKG